MPVAPAAVQAPETDAQRRVPFAGQTDISAFVKGLDAATAAHMEWTRRVLRCAVTRQSPGDDVLLRDAHLRCDFGHFLTEERSAFERLDPDGTQILIDTHREMHEAIRRICECVMKGQPGREEDLTTFEVAQRRLLHLLSSLKTQALTRSATIDPLTGLPLRHGLERDFGVCHKDSTRRGERFYLLLIDLDHFKAINDRFGHVGGDAVLQHFVQILRATLRESDPLYRFGGEEFLAFLRCGPDFDLASFARRLVRAIRAASLQIDQISVDVRATLGLYKVQAADQLVDAIRMADLALYAGKHAGRDQCVLINIVDGVQVLSYINTDESPTSSAPDGALDRTVETRASST